MQLLLVLALDREGSIIAALVALIVAALMVSIGAWVLLAKERREGGARRVRARLRDAPTEVLPDPGSRPGDHS
jgi:hypothetical protein